jgi:hypothetical protein
MTELLLVRWEAHWVKEVLPVASGQVGSILGEGVVACSKFLSCNILEQKRTPQNHIHDSQTGT